MAEACIASKLNNAALPASRTGRARDIRMEDWLSRCQHTRKDKRCRAIEALEALRKRKRIAKTHHQADRRRPPREQRNALEDGELGERWLGLLRLAQD